MALFVHRSERADGLAAGLAQLLKSPVDDPFAEEIVAVPARGVERWLAQQLSLSLGSGPDAADGVCANIRFPSPAALIREILGTPDVDPWAPDNLVWPLLEVLQESAGETWADPLVAHLGMSRPVTESGREPLRGRKYALARRMAGLFASYAAYRPQVLRDWANQLNQDGLGATLPADLQWQPELWRRLRDRIGAADPVGRTEDALTQLRTQPHSSILPSRVSIFGSTRLPIAWLEVFAGLAESRDVHLWLPHPSPGLWRKGSWDRMTTPRRRKGDFQNLADSHPLLSSLGRESRELQLALSRWRHHDEYLPMPDGSNTLLKAMQSGIIADQRPPTAEMRLDPTDRSIQVHACHGITRQVEVLRDVITGLLAADSTLQPRDILIMCPDIESYAAQFKAVFGLAEYVDGGHPAHRLPVRLADRALHQTNPIMSVVARILALADGRVTLSEVLDLASLPPVRRRFGFDDRQLELFAQWAETAGVRWGMTAAQRLPFSMQHFPHGTWRSGLDRLLAGVAMTEEDGNWLGLALPLDDVDSADIEAAGRLAEFLDRLAAVLVSVSSSQTVAQWVSALTSATDLLTFVSDTDSWQPAAWRRELTHATEGAAERADQTELSLADIRALLGARLAGRPTRANFRTGALTVCTMVPMRSVPQRVVCLLGLDDGTFPRAAYVDGDDVLARDPAVGERDPRGEDRQLMLDALMAATENFVVLYSGADERTGAERPPAVPVGELLDAIDSTSLTAIGQPARSQVLTRHPLQPFDKRLVTDGALGRAGYFSFDPAVLASVHSANETRSSVSFLASRLDPQEASQLELTDLIAILEQPARGFLRQRLDVETRVDGNEHLEALPVDLSELERWRIGEKLLQDRLAGLDVDTCRQLEWRRGRLPPGALGGRILEELLAEVEPLSSATEDLRNRGAGASQAARGVASADDHSTETVDVNIVLDDGSRLSGSVTGVYGDRVVVAGYRKLAAGQRLRAWINLLVLSAADPHAQYVSHIVGRHHTGRPWQSILGPVSHDQAWETLAELVDLRDRALREPLPMSLGASSAYARSRRDFGEVADAVQSARAEWAGDKATPGENAMPAHRLVWGQNSDLSLLLAAPPGVDENWTGEPTRFGDLALRLWRPLYAAEHEEALW